MNDTARFILRPHGGIWFKPHRGALLDSMRDSRHFDSLDEMFDFIAEDYKDWPSSDIAKMGKSCLFLSAETTFDDRIGALLHRVGVLTPRIDPPNCIGHAFSVYDEDVLDKWLDDNREALGRAGTAEPPPPIAYADNRESLLKQVADIVAEHFELVEPPLPEDDFVDKLGCDYFDVAEILMAVEDRFDTMITESEADELTNCEKIVELLMQRGITSPRCGEGA